MEKLEIRDEKEFEQSDVRELLRSSGQDRITVGILGSGYAAGKLTEILQETGKEQIRINWILRRKELNAISQKMNVINSKEEITPVSVVINTELTQPEWSSRFLCYGDVSVDLEHLIRVASGC